MAKRSAPKRRPASGRRAAPPRRKASRKTAPRKKTATRPKRARKPARKPARKAAAKAAKAAARRRTAPRTTRKTGKAAGKVARRSKAGSTKRATTKRKPAPTPAKAARQKPAPSPAPAAVKRRPKAAAEPAGQRRRALPAPDLDRERRRLPDDERLGGAADSGQTGSGDSEEGRLIAAARTGHAEMRERLRNHPESSPALSGGDVDARWEDAYASGEEAPGGSSPTPDQDRVEDIGKSLGITYEDNQELEGGEELADRDRHRWEYDPASSEDWPRERDED